MCYPEARKMSLWEFNLKADGYRRLENKSWHKLRVLATILISPHLKKGRTIKPEDLIPLPDDIKKPVMSADEIQADITRKLRSYHATRKTHC